MAGEFDFLKFAGDLGKGAADIAKNAADAVGDAVGKAVEAVGATTAPPEREAHYRDGMRECRGHVKSRIISVRHISGVDCKGRELANREYSIKMSKHGVELMVGKGLRARPFKLLRVRNCVVYVGGSTGFGNPVLDGMAGGYGGSIAGGACNPLLAPVGAVIGVVGGIGSALTPHDVWNADICEYDGTVWTFQLEGISDGEALLQFLDLHYSL